MRDVIPGVLVKLGRHLPNSIQNNSICQSSILNRLLAHRKIGRSPLSEQREFEIEQTHHNDYQNCGSGGVSTALLPRFFLFRGTRILSNRGLLG